MCDHESCVDIGLHSYRCNHCGEVLYYSQAAKDIAEGNNTKDAKRLRALERAMRGV